MMKFRGMGLYPDELNPQGVACYDPNRPSWLPDFIDTPTESACYYNSPTLTGQAGAVVGDTISSVTAGVLGGATGISSDLAQTLAPWVLGGAAALGFALIILPMLRGR